MFKSKPMKYLLTTAFIFLNVLLLVAQSDFRSGYIITNKNDTLHGFIAYRSENANANKCIYKETEDSEIRVFKPSQINGYRYANNKYYISKTIPKGNKTKMLFLEYLIDGIVDIYHYRDADGRHYFVENENGKLYELKNEKREITVDNVRYIKESKEYIGLLKAIFKESPSIANRARHVNLSHKSLIKITRDYHNRVCEGEKCIVYKKKLPKRAKSFGVVAGLKGMEIVQTGEIRDWQYYLRGADFGFNIYPSIGLYYKIGLPRLNERLFFQYEATYSHINLSTSTSYLEPALDMTHLNDITLKINSIQNSGVIKYEFPKGKIRPTFHAGLFFDYAFNTVYSRNLVVKFSWGETDYTRQFRDNSMGIINWGMNCGVGIRYNYLNDKVLFLDLRYQRGYGIFQNMNTNTFIINLNFQIGS